MDANVCEIAESRILADQPALVPSMYTASYRRTTLHFPTRRIAESDIRSGSKEASAMVPQCTIVELDVWNVSFSTNLHAN